MRDCEQNYAPTKFYALEETDQYRRYVVLCSEITVMKKLLLRMLDFFNADLVVMIKTVVAYDEISKEYDWDYYTGDSNRDRVLDSINMFEDYIFHDPSHQLLVRDKRSHDYFTFDEHGTLFIYTDRNVEYILEQHSIPFENNHNLKWECGQIKYVMGSLCENFEKLKNYLGLSIRKT